MDYKPWQVLEVEWVDSMSDDGRWVRAEAFEHQDSDLKHVTVGYFLRATDAALLLVQSRSTDEDENPNVSAVMAIPLRAIDQVRTLQPKREKRGQS